MNQDDMAEGLREIERLKGQKRMAQSIIDELRSELKVPEGRSVIEVATERMIERDNLRREVCLLHDATIILRNCIKGHEHLSAWCAKGLRDAEAIMNQVSQVNGGERL